MKVISIMFCRVKPDTATPTIVTFAHDVSSFGYFQRGTVREMVTFFARTFLKRTPPGKRQSVEHEEYLCHCYVRVDGLGACFVADKEYPARVAFTLLSRLLEEFNQKYSAQWNGALQDVFLPFPPLDKALAEFQDPAKADKIMKIQKDLDETVEVMHKTIDSVLERGVKLDTLVAKSDNLSSQSKLFYKQAKKHNQCCTIC